MKQTVCIVLSLLTICLPVYASDKAASANKKGLQAYDEENFEDSVKHFSDAVIQKPDSPELKFNLGTALSGMNENEEALRQLGIAANGLKDDGMKAAARYNAGNTLTASGNLESAIEEYKKAVKLDQTSEDIRHNLEIAVREWKKQQKNKENNKENQDGEKKEENNKDKKENGENENKENNKEKDEPGEKEKEEYDREKDDKSDKGESKEKDKQQQSNQQEQESKQESAQNKKMTPEEAKRILDALNEEEKKALALRRSLMKTDVKQGDNW